MRVEELIEALRSDDPIQCRRALHAVTGLGTDARLAVPALIALISRPAETDPQHLAGLAAHALFYIGGASEATPALAALLKRPGCAFFAAMALGCSEDPAAVQPLIDALSSPHDEPRRAAIHGLAHFGRSAQRAAQRATPYLLAAYRDEALVDERGAIVFSLGEIGPPSRAVADVIFEYVLSLPLDAPFRRDSIRAPYNLFFTDEIAPPWLVERYVRSLDDGPDDLAYWMALALGAAEDPRGAPALVRAASRRPEEVRVEAIRSLGLIGTRAAETMPALVAALDDPSGRIRGIAAFALSFVRDAALPLLSRLEEMNAAGLLQPAEVDFAVIRHRIRGEAD